MDRRNAIAIAIAVGGTVLASGAAFAANVGLLQEDDDPVGQLETTNVSELLDGSTTTTPQTIIIDVPVGTGGTPTGTGQSDDDGTPDQGSGDAVTGDGSDDGFDDEFEDYDDEDSDDQVDDDSDDGSDDHGDVDDDHDDD